MILSVNNSQHEDAMAFTWIQLAQISTLVSSILETLCYRSLDFQRILNYYKHAYEKQ